MNNPVIKSHCLFFGVGRRLCLATEKWTRQPPHRLELQVRVMLVHVLAPMAGQLLADLKRNVGIGHRRIEAVSERMER